MIMIVMMIVMMMRMMMMMLTVVCAKVTSDRGVPYEFTFNTWGIAPSPYPEDDPQRHGKAAYAGLVHLDAAKAYVQKHGEELTIVEIGCGTGAGANLITRELLTKSRYIAIDMQAAAIRTCRKKHGTADNSGLKCVHSPGGVGNGGNQAVDETGAVIADGTVDFVIISETHIADIEIGPEEKMIFNEIQRMLKPGGLFLWGNALPTRVWVDAVPYLNGHGFKMHDNLNHTQGAVTARDEVSDQKGGGCASAPKISWITNPAARCMLLQHAPCRPAECLRLACPSAVAHVPTCLMCVRGGVLLLLRLRLWLRRLCCCRHAGRATGERIREPPVLAVPSLSASSAPRPPF
jgi:SAM-dependent methyltransferase